jgi:single-stranded-DNA-specific exonuclease
VIGIVAGRLKEAYDKPTFVFSRIEDQDGRKLAKGSARSMPDYDLGASVIAARQNGLLVKGGGHAMAAGATLDLEQADAFRAFLEAEVRRSEFARTGPTCRVDAALHPSRADLPFIASLEALEPFGQGNPRPRFLLRGCFLRNSRWLKEKHFKTTITKGGAELSAILFIARGTPLGDGIAGNLDRPLDLVVTLDINEWKDRRTPQAMIEDARPSRLTED